MRHPGIPGPLRGTYAGLAHPAAIDHLTRLGVTAVELLPVHQFAHEDHLLRRGLRNYWGYNSVGYFAPHAGYARRRHPAASRSASSSAWSAPCTTPGIEVILDVVYNHTAEAGERGPTLSLRGIDNRGYYRLGGRRPPLRRLHRLRQHPARRPAAGAAPDHRLAALLGAGDGRRRLPVRPGGRPGPLRCTTSTCCSPFLAVIAQDPVLRRVKLIAEPWDVGAGGYQVGRLPAAVDRVERPVPRHRPRLLARRAARRARSRLPALRLQRPLRLGRPPPVRLRQLHHRARRVHPARPGVATTASTTRPTARTTGTAPTTTAPGTAAPRARPTTRTSWRCGGGSCATCWPRCCCPPACRCSSPATRWGAPRAATTTPTARTTRPAGSTGRCCDDRGWRRTDRPHRPADRPAPRPPGAAPPAFFSGRAHGPDGLRDVAWFGARGAGDDRGGLVRAGRHPGDVPLRPGHPAAGRARANPSRRRQLPADPARGPPPGGLRAAGPAVGRRPTRRCSTRRRRAAVSGSAAGRWCPAGRGCGWRRGRSGCTGCGVEPTGEDGLTLRGPACAADRRRALAGGGQLGLPDEDRAGRTVTVHGSGFAGGATVHFGNTPAEPPTSTTATAITVKVPHRVPDPRTVDVTVTVGVAASPTGSANEFAYGLSAGPRARPGLGVRGRVSGRLRWTVTVEIVQLLVFRAHGRWAGRPTGPSPRTGWNWCPGSRCGGSWGSSATATTRSRRTGTPR